MTTYTEHLKLRKPEIGQPSWGDELHDNAEIQDFITGGFKAGNTVLSGCAPSDGGGLDVDYAGGEVSVNGTRYTIASGSKTCTADSKNWLCVDASGVVQVYTTAPTAAYAALAMIDAGAAAIDRIADCRKLAEGAAAFDIAYTPDNYAPDTGESKEIEQHLAGIDNQIGFMGAFKNKLINGGFDIWQRGTTQTATGYGSDDRWLNYHSGSTKTQSREAFAVGQTDVPGNPKYYARIIVTTSGAASSNVQKEQRIESVYTLAGESAVLSFWAKADAAKNIAIEFGQLFGNGGSTGITGIGVTTIALTTAWQRFTVPVTFPSIAGKTIGGNSYLSTRIWFDAGSNYDARTNSLGTQSGTFDLSQMQLEAGEVATPFQARPLHVELSLCQRYYEKTFQLSNAPTDNLQDGRNLNPMVAYGTGTAQNQNFYKVRKRANPSSYYFYQPGNQAGSPGTWSYYTGSTWVPLTSTALARATEIGFRANTLVSGLTKGDSYLLSGHWAVDAEL